MSRCKNGNPKFTIRFPEPFYSELAQFSKNTERTVTDVVRQATKEYLAKAKAMESPLMQRGITEKW